MLGEDVRAADAPGRRPHRRRRATRASSRSWSTGRRAAFAAWYEMFPRSQSGDPQPPRHLRRRDRAAAVRPRAWASTSSTSRRSTRSAATNRKGRNNTLTAEPGRSRQPLRDRRARRAATTRSIPSSARSTISAGWSTRPHEHGLEIALDFAIQCSPDHPWLKEHPEWFDWRPGRHDQVRREPAEEVRGHRQRRLLRRRAAVDCGRAARRGAVLGRAGREDLPRRQPAHQAAAVLGVDDRARCSDRHPDVIFLAEAFTRPKMMQRLAKVGFTQSYTYFTWRNTKQELTEYLTELTHRPSRRSTCGRTSSSTRPTSTRCSCRPAGRAGFQIRARAGGDAVAGLRHLQRLRAVRGHAAPGQRGVSRLREVRDQGLGLGPARQHQRRHRRAQPHPPRQPGAAELISTCASTTPGTTTSSVYGKTTPAKRQHRSWSPSTSTRTTRRRPTSRCRCGSSACRTSGTSRSRT